MILKNNKYYNIINDNQFQLPLGDDELFIYQIDYTANNKLLLKFCLLDRCFCFYSYEVIKSEFSKTVSYKISYRSVYELVVNCGFYDACRIILSNFYSKFTEDCSYKHFDDPKYNDMCEAFKEFFSKIQI